MNKLFQKLVNEIVNIEISGKKKINGTLIDVGSDIAVVFNGKDYVYIPLIHIQNIKLADANEYDILGPKEPSAFVSEDDSNDLSLRKVLTRGKGMFVEIFVTGKQELHGYLTSIMNNYFVFHSPVFKTMYITLNHLKWIIPYTQEKRPYGLESHNFPIQPTNTLLARSFEVQMEKFKNKMVVINLGENNTHIGKINNIAEQMVEIQTARDEPVLINLHHIKAFHQV